MTVYLQKDDHSRSDTVIGITGSKSESNRLIVLRAIFPNITLENISESDDTLILKEALSSQNSVIDIHHAGTAMRFLTAYFSLCQGKSVTLTGSKRMCERPIGILVESLKSLGADIEYLDVEGYPPLKINGKNIQKGEVNIDASVSSQYVSALMLIAPALPQGLNIRLHKAITSAPYIEMTLSLLNEIGVKCNYTGNTIAIEPTKSVTDKCIEIESDWSSASYFYSCVALSDGLTVTLKNFKEKSKQGDAVLPSIYKKLGVKTTFNASEHSITLSKYETEIPKEFKMDLIATPDIAQSIAVTCFGLKVSCTLTGLQTLKIKETDRLNALKTQLQKLGAKVGVTNSTITITPSTKIIEDSIVETYEDHRMAMAFAPLSLLVPLKIADPMVVTKSYPTFWKDLELAGISVQFQ